MKEALGVAATTCSYADLIGTDLVVFVGSNVAQNQPVTMKYLYHARKAGTKVAVVNPYREPAMERYWVPSNLESALFGTKMTDRFFEVSVGGDIAFLNGVLKHMVERGWVDRAFIEGSTTGFEELALSLARQGWEELERGSGTSREEMLGLARMLGEARTAVLVWSMGVTQHSSGEDAVRAIINLALSRGFVGREKCGLMPVRGHSGVQGGAEMGAYSTAFPGGLAVNEENAQQLSRLWGFEVPSTRGLMASEMIEAAHDGRLDVLVSSGGNFLEVLPQPRFVEEALGRVPLRVHMDIVASSQMMVDSAGAVVLLPVQTRYEMQGGVTETSTERRVIFSPEIRGPRVAEARPEWQVFTDIAARARPELAESGPFRRASTDPRRHFPVRPYVLPHQDAGAGGRPVPVRRPAAVRRLAVPDHRRQGPFRCGGPAGPGSPRGLFRPGNAPRAPVQFHGAGRPRRPHRGRQGLGADKPSGRAGPWCRGRGTGDASQRRRRACRHRHDRTG